MTVIAARDRGSPTIRHAVDALFRRQPQFASAALVIAAIMPATLFASFIDHRMLGGVDVWIKPLRFELSLALYLATLAFFAGYLPAGTLQRRWHRIFAAVVVVAIAAELAWLLGAAGAGVASHFNRETLFMEAVYSAMGVAAVTLSLPTLVYGVLILRNRAGVLPHALRLGIGLSLVMTFVLTLVTAGTMASGTSHLVGNSGGAILAFMGWARDAGDLRVAHFFATHAMHVIPLFALLSVRLFGPRRTLPVLSFSALYAMLVALTFLQALDGRPFLPALG